MTLAFAILLVVFFVTFVCRDAQVLKQKLAAQERQRKGNFIGINYHGFQSWIMMFFVVVVVVDA